MKKTALISIIYLLLLLTMPQALYAQQSATPSASASSSATPKASATVSQEDKIKNLKDRLATKVAELRQSQKGTVWGTIKQKTADVFTLITSKDDLTVAYSEDDTIIKVLSNGKLADGTVDSIKVNLHTTVFGIIDTEGKKVDAKYMLLKQKLVPLVGTVTEKDATQGTISIQTNNNERYIVDIEASTRINSFTDSKIIKSGLSKIAESDRIHIRGAITSTGDEKRIQALNILHIPVAFFQTSPSSSPSATPETKNQ